LRPRHPLAAKARLKLEDLIEYPWVGPSIPARVRAVLPNVDKPFGTFDASTDRFHPRVLVETFSAAKDIVLAGQGLGAALKGQIEPELKRKRLVILPAPAPWLRLNYGFIVKRGRTPSPAAVAFMEAVRTIERGVVAQAIDDHVSKSDSREVLSLTPGRRRSRAELGARERA
jgi:DNA-binding transcriptional LysR family regulator